MRIISILILWLLKLSLPCNAADVLFIGDPHGSAAEQRQLEIATRFYGVDLTVVIPSLHDRDLGLTKAIESSSTLAVVIAGSALALVDPKEVLQALNGKPGGSVPLLILGVTPETAGALLKTWSGGAAIACRRAQGLNRVRYNVTRIEGLTGELADLDLPIDGNEAAYFVMGQHSNVEPITQVRTDQQTLPVFIETDVDRQRIFLNCTQPSLEHAEADGTEPLSKLFSKLAPVMMVVRSSVGERGWHAIHHYANLTIDDPWLLKRYGFLDYRGLLAQMDAHNFHSTIAFVPWNYDRSETEVVALFRNHPERFSISVHGDNHDHKEFTDYQSVPLAQQVATIDQALARMDRFQSLTGIPYDKVMVFPHSIAPEKTLTALRDKNFLATVNSSNVPMDATTPSSSDFALRSVTLSYGGIPSIRRYSMEAPLPAGLSAMNAFLGNPLIFYCHQLFFSSGIDAFDAEADEVNRVQPNTLWRGLGDIVRHLYFVKLRDDGDYDVLGFSDTSDLENVFHRDSTFYFTKKVTVQPGAVTVDGQRWPYVLHDGNLEAQIGIPSGKSRTLSITYGNNSESKTADITKTSLRVRLLRLASDFRDVTLAQTAPGRRVIRLYYDNGAPLTLVLLCALAVVTSSVFGGCRLRAKLKSRAAR